MGIRIHKDMGYVTENFVFDIEQYEEICELLSYQNLYNMCLKDNVFSDMDKLDSADNIGAFLCHAQLKNHSRKNDGIYNSFRVEDDEETDKPFLLVKPFGLEKGWSRYDDDIDYVQYHMDSQDGELGYTRIRYYDRALYPYESFMDKTNANRIKDYYGIRSMKSHFKDVTQFNEYVKKLSGYDTWDDLEKVATPTVPYDIYLLLKYSGCFKNPRELWLSMRPAIVESWS